MKIEQIAKSIPKDVMDIVSVLNGKECEAYVVGGSIRDVVMGKEPKDWDLCTNATPEEIEEMFQEKGYRLDLKGKEYGTVVVFINEEPYEITTYRTESGYEDARHPGSVGFVKNIEEDLKRRDFTINAMAYNPINNDFKDLFGGLEDLKNGVIRTVGEPKERFEEDHLRIVRALRFAIKYDFEIDEDTFKAMMECHEMVSSVSKERITNELEKILTCGKPISPMFIKSAPIVFEMIPELKPCYKFNQNNKYHKHDVYEHLLGVTDLCNTDNFIIKLAALLHDVGKPCSYVEDEFGHGHFYGHPEKSYEIVRDNVIYEDFKLTVPQMKELLELVRRHDMEIFPTEKSVKRALSKFSKEFLDDWFILKQADIDDHILPANEEPPMWTRLEDIKNIYDEVVSKNKILTTKNLAVSGTDIMNILNIRPGKEVGNCLQELLDAVIDGKVQNDYDSLVEYVSNTKGTHIETEKNEEKKNEEEEDTLEYDM